jgi:hypothetical protein
MDRFVEFARAAIVGLNVGFAPEAVVQSCCRLKLTNCNASHSARFSASEQGR